MQNMNSTIKDGMEIVSDGKTVWINSEAGCCLGRFSKNGIDIHKDVEQQMTDGQQCLDCKPGPVNLFDWRRFQSGMLRFYGVVVTDRHIPIYLKTRYLKTN